MNTNSAHPQLQEKLHSMLDNLVTYYHLESWSRSITTNCSYLQWNTNVMDNYCACNFHFKTHFIKAAWYLFANIIKILSYIFLLCKNHWNIDKAEIGNWIPASKPLVLIMFKYGIDCSFTFNEWWRKCTLGVGALQYMYIF